MKVFFQILMISLFSLHQLSSNTLETKRVFKIVVFDQEKHSFIEAAMVDIECGNQKFQNMTDELGYAYFSLPNTEMISLKVSMTGFKELTVDIPIDDKRIYFIGLSSNRTEYFVL